MLYNSLHRAACLEPTGEEIEFWTEISSVLCFRFYSPNIH